MKKIRLREFIQSIQIFNNQHNSAIAIWYLNTIKVSYSGNRYLGDKLLNII